MTNVIKTIIPLAIVLFLALQKGSGFGLPVMLSAFLLAALVNVARMIRRREERKRAAMRLAIWSAALILVGAVVVHWDTASRREADVAVRAVLAHKARTGRYPARLSEIGLDEQALHKKWGIRLITGEGGPVLVYPSSVMPLSTYDYDFEKGKWVLNAY